MTASCGTWRQLTKVTIIYPRGLIPLLFMCLEVVVEFNSNGYIFNKGFEGLILLSKSFCSSLSRSFLKNEILIH